jgi:glycosyltransferase involved in cell wall biosynthesis
MAVAGRVSVITPSFNQGRFVERTIQSVLAQGVVNLDYVVFDGGSTDDTVAILRRYEPAVRWVSEPDRGQAHAVNKGLQATSGEIIGWLNSDDVYYPGAIAAACGVFESAPDVDVVYGDAHHIDESDQIIEPYPTAPWNTEQLKNVCYLCQPAVFFRRRVVARLGGLDERLHYCLDYEYWLRLAQGQAKFFHLPRVLAGSRLYAETKTLGARVEVHREINQMQRACLGQVADQWLFNYAHAVADNRGYQRSDRFRFALAVAALSCYASLRWNRRLSGTVCREATRWVVGNARGVLGEALAK